MTLETGAVLNNIYRVVNLLGKGSMGNVYLVERIEDDKKFVVKELNFSQEAGLDHSTAKEIFHREAEFMAKINHHGVPKMYGVFSQDGKNYLTMDYIEGKTLEEIINSSDLPLKEEDAIKWTIELAAILDYLHNSFHQPIVYRDLKPANIIIKPDGKTVLVDFGIARYYNPDKENDTFSYGSPGYAAPEQYKGRGRSTPQTDIFALGVILFQMLTKYDPSLKPLTFPSMKSINPAVSEKLEIIVKRSIELEPLKRYISVQEFKETLEKYAHIRVPTKSKKPPKNPNKWAVRSNQFACATIAVFVINILLFSITPNLTRVIRFDGTARQIDITAAWILVTPIFLCPVAGLITGIIGSIKAAGDIFGEPAGNAIGCNIFIIIVLILLPPIMVPNFLCARASAHFAACESNLKKLATALDIYASENNGVYPAGFYKLLEESKNKEPYMSKIPDCVKSNKFYDKKDLTSYEYTVSKDFKNFTIWCTQGHLNSGGPTGYPQYSPSQGLILK